MIVCPGSTLLTVSDNVIARIHENEADAVPELLAVTLNAAEERGYAKYFGVITSGKLRKPTKGMSTASKAPESERGRLVE